MPLAAVTVEATDAPSLINSTVAFATGERSIVVTVPVTDGSGTRSLAWAPGTTATLNAKTTKTGTDRDSIRLMETPDAMLKGKTRHVESTNVTEAYQAATQVC